MRRRRVTDIIRFVPIGAMTGSVGIGGTISTIVDEEKKMKKLSIDDLMAEIWAAGWNRDREKYDNAAYEISSRFENIKCCGNCENWFEHKCYCFHNWNPHKYCKNWVSDRLTTEIRGF